jgi:hypothetical protein
VFVLRHPNAVVIKQNDVIYFYPFGTFPGIANSGIDPSLICLTSLPYHAFILILYFGVTYVAEFNQPVTPQNFPFFFSH